MAKSQAAPTATSEGTAKAYTSFYLGEETRSRLDRLVADAGIGASRSTVVVALIDEASDDEVRVRITQLAAELAKLTGAANPRPGRKRSKST